MRTRTPTTTTHVQICIIKPDTLGPGCSYARHLLREGKRALVSRPTVFLSHAWRFDFKDLVAVAEHYVDTQPDDERARIFFCNDTSK